MEIFVIIIILLIFLFISYCYCFPTIKGKIGESRVSRILKNLNSEEYKVLNNIYLPTSNGISQIDHIIISIYGIFVIETKNYKGWIHGHENSEYWTQTIFKYKTRFRNPIKQNWSHIYALKEVLANYQQAIYHPIVVFAGSSELKNVTSNLSVIYDFHLLREIRNNSTNINLSIQQVDNIVNILNILCIKDKQIKNEHIQQLGNHSYKRKNIVNSPECPQCGGNLGVREGPYGNFYGCSNYPKCRFTAKMRS
jgi:hypothetical protein